MAKRFDFDPQNKVYAYSVERLIDLSKIHKTLAYQYIIQGTIEAWLYTIGENELSDLVNHIQHDPQFTEKANNDDKVDLICDRLSAQLNNRKFFELLDIDQAIEITLREYNTLRTEILQNVSEITQRLFLGLAAIFTISSLGLSPLSTFLNNQQSTSIMPSIIIFVVLIPSLSLYLIYRSLFVVEKTTIIGQYIYFRIEKKIVNLTKLKKLHKYGDLEKINKNINFNSGIELKIDNIEDDKLQDYFTHLSWEHYVRGNSNFIDSFDLVSILGLLTMIIFISWLGGSILFLLYVANITILDGFSLKEIFTLLVVIIPFILWLISLMFLWIKGFRIRGKDQKKLKQKQQKSKKISKQKSFDSEFKKIVKEMWNNDKIR